MLPKKRNASIPAARLHLMPYFDRSDRVSTKVQPSQRYHAGYDREMIDMKCLTVLQPVTS